MKGTIHQEEKTIVNLYMSNVGTLNFIKQTLLDLKAQIDPQHDDSRRLQYSIVTDR
jgi:hypothetical protein